MALASTLPPDFVALIINIHEMIARTAEEDIPEAGHFRETVGKVEAAVARIDERVFGHESFKTIEAKAAILIKELNDLHCFPDGNKRTSLVAMAYYLFWNGRPFVNTTTEEEMVRRIADPTGALAPEFGEIVTWVRDNTERLDVDAISKSPRFGRYASFDIGVRVELTPHESKDRIAIRADAHDPKTGRQLSPMPFLRRIFDFDRKSEKNKPPELSADPETKPAASAPPANASRNRRRRNAKNKRKRRARR